MTREQRLELALINLAGFAQMEERRYRDLSRNLKTVQFRSEAEGRAKAFETMNVEIELYRMELEL